MKYHPKSFYTSISKKVVSFLLILLIFFFIFRELSRNWEAVALSFVNIKISLLLLSFVFGILYNLLIALGWHTILILNREKVNLSTSNRLLVTGNLGKYIPGKVWQFAGRLYLFSNIGIKKINIIKYGGIELLLFILSAAVVFLCSVYFYNDLFKSYEIFRHKHLVLMGVALSFVFLSPPILNRILTLGLKMRHIEGDAKIKSNIKWLHISILQGIYITAWIFAGLSLAFLVFAMSNIRFDLVGFMIGSLSIAYIIGYISLFAPGGIGVREGILTLLLSLVYPLGFSAAVAIAFRLLSTFCEIVYVMVSHIVPTGNNQWDQQTEKEIYE